MLTYRGERLRLGQRRRRRAPAGAARARRRGSGAAAHRLPRPAPPDLRLRAGRSCCPRTGRPRPALRRPRARCARAHGGDRAAGRVAARPGARRARLPGRERRGGRRLAVREHGPLTVEGMDAGLVAALRARNPVETARGRCRGGGWLFVETGGGDARRGRRRAAQAVVAACGRRARRRLVVTDPARMRALWRIREDAAGTATRMPGRRRRPGRAGRTARCRPPRLGAYLRDFRRCSPSTGCAASPYGHFGDGCIHVRIDFDLLTRPGVALPRLLGGARPTWSSRTAARCPASTATGWPGPSCCPGCTADDLAAFRPVQGPLGPGRPAEPRARAGPARLDENLRFVGAPDAAASTSRSASPHDGGDFSGGRAACLGVAKCVTASRRA